MLKDQYKNIFSRQMETTVVTFLQIFLQHAGKCQRTAYSLLRGIFTFHCSLVRFCERTNIFLLLKQ